MAFSLCGIIMLICLAINVLFMKLRQSVLIALLLLFSLHSVAGANPVRKKHVAGRATASSPAEENYDIKYLKFNLHLTDTSVYVAGDVLTMAQVVVSSMSTYAFELDSSFTIDSAKINGVNMSVSRAGYITSISLSSPLAAGTMFTAQIFYHGLPPGGAGGFFNGITHSVTSHGTNCVFTISDPYVALNWWPCKQSILDKIDSVDMFVTVPAGVVDGSNGVLVGVDSTTTTGFWKYHWQTHYPIDYYLISVAVAKYAQYKSYWHFTGSTDSVLIHNFFLDTASFNPAYKANFDSIGMYLDYFSSLYGRYPFWKEKYGVCYTTLPGGMEHQTMTTIGVPNTYIIAHEMCHQWFGDHLTYSTWRDVWLSEGFATFSEQLFLNHFWTPAAALAHRQTYLGYVLGEGCGMTSVSDTLVVDSLFDQRTVYAKGAGVIRMLQYIAPSDSIFFQVLKTYQQTYGFGNANTAQFKAIAESLYGTSLDTFFNQWIYGKGYPQFRVSWDQVGSTAYVKLIQTRSCSAYPTHFYTPVELQLHSASGDTIIKVYNASDTQTYVFDWAPTMTAVYLNPDVWTICQQFGVIKHDTTLRVGAVIPDEIKVYPNPTHSYWQVADLQEGVALALFDNTGRTIWTGTSNGGNTTVPGQKLPPGDYVLQMGEGHVKRTVTLVHW